MPISAIRRLMTGGWGNPKIDIKDPSLVLYAPLWRPDMIASGGYIASGTGTMAVTPLTLVIGANTVTALTAGTFIIYSPVGGTCASGTATITGSPVTLVAGIATTVTTGVTTGNFTVTTSNIIMSRNIVPLSCTITGATWTPRGRSFDGTDDDIYIGQDVVELELTTFSAVVWASPITNTINKVLFYNGDLLSTRTGWGLVIRKSDDATNPHEFYLEHSADGEPVALYGSAVTYGSFQMLTATFNATGRVATIYQNDTQTGTSSEVLPTPTWTGNNRAYVGSIWKSDTGIRYGQGKGTYGDVWIYNRILSAGEIKNLYQVTKWRYL